MIVRKINASHFVSVDSNNYNNDGYLIKHNNRVYTKERKIMEYHKINQDDLKVLSSYISDPARFITNPTTHWDHDQFNTVRAMPDLVIQPVTNEEVQKVVKYASDHNIPIVPRGNSTGLMGANLTVKVASH